MSGSRRGVMRSPWFAIAVVAGAAWVNRDFVAEFFEDSMPDTGFIADAVGADPTPTPGATGAPAMAMTFAPVRLETVLEDPFAHDLETRMAALGKRGSRSQASTPAELIEGLKLPTVRLVLLGESSKRALVDDAIVGVGDAISIGTVEAVLRTGIRVRTEQFGMVDVPLATRDEPTPTREKQTDDDPEPPLGEGNER